MIHRTMAVLVGLTASVATSAAQDHASAQGQTPEPAPSQAASLRDELGGALRQPLYEGTSESLRQKHGDAAVLEALLEEFERCPGCPQDGLAHAQAFRLLLDLLADGASADAEHDARVGQILRPNLHDPVSRGDTLLATLHLREGEQQAMVPALLPLLDDEDASFVAEVCRVLGHLGPAAGSAMPRLEELVRAKTTAGASRHALRVRAQAAEARILISGEVAVDAGLYPALDAAGQQAVALPISSLLSRMGIPHGVEAHRLALARYYLEWLAGASFPESDPDALRPLIALLRLQSDETDESIRDAARVLLERWSHGEHERLAEFARSALDVPEVPYAHDESPAPDPRVETLFRPASSLLMARDTSRGLLAVSICKRDALPTRFPPEISMVFVWDVVRGALLRRTDGVRGNVLSAALAADGSFVVVGTSSSEAQRPADGLVVIPLDGRAAPRILPGHESGAGGIVLFSDGRRAASMGGDQIVRITDLEAGSVLRQWPADGERWRTCFAIDAAGRRLFAGGSDLSLVLYDIESGDRVAGGSTSDESRPVSEADVEFFNGDPRCPVAAACLPDGERWLVGDMLGRLSVWDPRSTGPPVALSEAGSPVQAIVLSPDGRRVAISLGGTWLNRRLRHPSNFSIDVLETATGVSVASLTGMWITPRATGFLDEGARVFGVSSPALRVWCIEPR